MRNVEMTDLTEKTLATERKYTGKIISVDLLDIELPDGRKAKREVIRHGNAVAILARRPDGKFVFVKQYRKAAEEALVEVIAGGLEPGEDPVEGAKRETAEETGYEVTRIKFLTTIICTPSFDGNKRAPLSRFTVLDEKQIVQLQEFFFAWGTALAPKRRPHLTVKLRKLTEI